MSGHTYTYRHTHSRRKRSVSEREEQGQGEVLRERKQGRRTERRNIQRERGKKETGWRGDIGDEMK